MCESSSAITILVLIAELMTSTLCNKQMMLHWRQESQRLKAEARMSKRRLELGWGGAPSCKVALHFCSDILFILISLLQESIGLFHDKTRLNQYTIYRGSYTWQRSSFGHRLVSPDQ
jgi:hypothetical protein